MKSESVFIDTSGFFALLVSNDPNHKKALKFLSEAKKNKTKAFTTDYVVDETITLLKVRKVAEQIPKLIHVVETSGYLKIVWTDQEIFKAGCDFVTRHSDHNYSFTDCISFIVMKKHRLSRVLTADKHFIEAGFSKIL